MSTCLIPLDPNFNLNISDACRVQNGPTVPCLHPKVDPDVFIACRYDDHPILCPEFRVYRVTSPLKLGPSSYWQLQTPVADLPIDSSVPLRAVIVGLSDQPMDGLDDDRGAVTV